jgi:hypothetical protein
MNLVSDKYYFKKFPFFANIDRVLESNAKLEGFDGQNYTSAKVLIIQHENFEYTPRILSAIERNYSFDILYGTFNMNLCFMNLNFKERSSRKIISDASFEKEIILPFGCLLDFKGTLSCRALNVSEKKHSDYDSSFGITPQLNCALKWPLILSSDFASSIFTPIIGIILSKSKKNIDVFEDQFCEITCVNFLNGNRSASSYNIDSGERIYYGFKTDGYCEGKNTYHFTVGRSVELTTTSDRPGATGLRYNHSDIVISSDVLLSEKWTFIANCSYSPQTKDWTRVEAGLNFSDKKKSFDVMVFRGKQCFYNPFAPESANSEEQKTQRYNGAILDIGWHTSSSTKLKGGIIFGNDNDSIIKSGNDRHRIIRQHIGLEYKNECISADISIEIKNFKGGDLKKETILRLAVNLKNLSV